MVSVLNSLSTTAPNVLLQYSLQYDAENNPIHINHQGDVHTYSYDSLDRLVHATHPSGLPTENYLLDNVGNRLSDQNRPNPAHPDTQWRYNANHQLIESATENTTLFGNNSQVINHVWDQSGNLIKKSTPKGTESTHPHHNLRYRYDAQNRLIETQTLNGSAILSYQYDPFGRRIRKTIYKKWNNAAQNWDALITPQTCIYLYSEEGLSAEYRQTGSDEPILHATYGWKPGSRWGTAPLWIRTIRSDTQKVERFYHHTDHLGMPLKTVDRYGNIVWSQRNTAFGEAIISSASIINNPLRFPGQYYDSETDTHYNWHRDYDPKTGRYLQNDPIGLDGGVNPYTYVNASPEKWIDTMGLCWDNARAIYHAYFGNGQDVTLQQIGCYNEVTQAIQSQLSSWKNHVEQSANQTAKALPCNTSHTFSLSRSVGAQSGIFWIRGFALKQEANCSADKKCCDNNTQCCQFQEIWQFNCSLKGSMHDPWVKPLDWDNSGGKDFWDNWELGMTTFHVDGEWNDTVSGGGSL